VRSRSIIAAMPRRTRGKLVIEPICTYMSDEEHHDVAVARLLIASDLRAVISRSAGKALSGWVGTENCESVATAGAGRG
jgi:hypothetical protein